MEWSGCLHVAHSVEEREFALCVNKNTVMKIERLFYNVIYEFLEIKKLEVWRRRDDDRR